MIYLNTGVPGSGKTYFNVYQIKKECELKREGKSKYKHIYTNINGLKYDELNKIANDPNFVKPFEFDELKKHIDHEYQLHNQFKNGYIQVEDYDEYAKSQGVYDNFINSCIFIDECHLYFETKATEPLIRFLSYHRHFDIDIYLITQNKNLIDKKYLAFVEKMYKALPASKRIFSKVFRYKVYASYQEYNQNIIETISLKLKKDVFSLYNSGSTQISKSVIHKFILPIVLLSILSFVGFYYFVNKKTKNNVEINQSQPQNIPVSTNIKNINSNQDYNQIDKFVLFECFSDSCKVEDTTFNFKIVKKIKDKFECSYFYNEYTSNSISTIILECKKDPSVFFKLFNRSSKDEKSSNNPFDLASK